MLTAQTWRQLRFIPVALGVVVLCLCVSTIYIVPTFGGRSSHLLSPRLRPLVESDDHSSSHDPLNGQHFTIPPQSSNGSHDETLGVFSQIFVISLAMRLDRRAALEQLRRALALNWTYVDAISPEHAIITGVSECVRFLRQQNNARFFEWSPDLDGATTSTSNTSLMDKTRPSVFSVPCVPPIPAGNPAIAPIAGFNHCLTPNESLPVVSKPRLHESSSTASSSVMPLTCAVANRIHGVEFHPSLPTHMLLTPSKLACWYSHISAIARFAGQAHGSRGAALFLEDDIDMERDIRQNVELVWSFLPSGWDIVFLGHCWSNESHYPALIKIQQLESLDITIHPSFAPKCTHAYALSHSGAHRLLLHLLHPPFSYSRALDQAFSWLVESKRLKAFSLVPSIVVQRKVDKSDIDGGEDGLGSKWKDHLKHGILDI
ncbi:hypothetical protein LXA43DRAFT_1022094 [Ganoderma leucocontextum]|nr:hypothetical protein LXA43DRAFT_1022094 [Ganoderma leucocontextum]